MNAVGSFLSSILYIVSSALLYPDLLLLVAGFFWTILSLGAFCSEWMERKRLAPVSAETFSRTMAEPADSCACSHRLRTFLVQAVSGNHLKNTAEIDHLMHQTRIQWRKSLDRLQLMVRLGPSLGLMGTLIPMSTGLASLTQGDMSRLSSDLVIAFTTTIVGLAIGMCAYWMHTVRKRWIEEDIEHMILAVDVLSNAMGEAEDP